MGKEICNSRSILHSRYIIRTVCEYFYENADCSNIVCLRYFIFVFFGLKLLCSVKPFVLRCPLFRDCRSK